MNRVDSIIVFRQLTQGDIRKIVDIILNEVNERLVDYELDLQATPAARDWLAKHGYDPEFGARPLRRLIQTEVEDLLSDAVLSGKFANGDTVLVDIDSEDKVILVSPPAQEGENTQDLEEALPT
ncbi:MAG: hypothetical protein R3E31_14520 [Chloroflexota bacterium]